MKYLFKTNIMCSGCLAKLTPYLADAAIRHWEVDIKNPDKILTVETDSLTGESIRDLVKQAGYTAATVS